MSCRTGRAPIWRFRLRAAFFTEKSTKTKTLLDIILDILYTENVYVSYQSKRRKDMKKVVSISLALLVCLSAVISLFVCYAETDVGDNTISYTDGETFTNPVANGADPFVFKDTDGTRSEERRVGKECL